MGRLDFHMFEEGESIDTRIILSSTDLEKVIYFITAVMVNAEKIESDIKEKFIKAGSTSQQVDRLFEIFKEEHRSRPDTAISIAKFKNEDKSNE